MTPHRPFSRRSFLAFSGTVPIAIAAAAGKSVPVGLELYSVRDELKKDVMGTVRAVAKMGYQAVEFYSPYFSWTPEYAAGVRKLMDDTGVRCYSTHNGGESFTPDGLKKAAELNRILGAKYIVMASAGNPPSLDAWKAVGERLAKAADFLAPLGLRAGYHNHQLEFTAVDGKLPMEVLAASTPKEVMLQFDAGTCVEAGADPVAWIRANPGRINSIHCKDWARGEGKGYKVLFNEGDVPWAKIFEAAESVGGVEFYLIEQEESQLPSLEAVQRCLANWKKFRTNPALKTKG